MPLTNLIADLVKVIEQLLPGVGNTCVDIGLLNDTLIAADKFTKPGKRESACPICNSVHLNWTSVDIDFLEDNPVAIQGESCMDCNARWEAVYVFSHLNLEGDDNADIQRETILAA